eukprot:TRINITY_DN842_c0_g1_i4.p1 TRINITY_DN842_c0_g1~~TRINITY_DN842_c0_g1_i4.p1  ORF type:complete len:894 (+),score=504.74 TRINITY_DN842_c0_g1_i4:133-2682(+)
MSQQQNFNPQIGVSPQQLTPQQMQFLQQQMQQQQQLLQQQQQQQRLGQQPLPGQPQPQLQQFQQQPQPGQQQYLSQPGQQPQQFQQFQQQPQQPQQQYGQPQQQQQQQQYGQPPLQQQQYGQPPLQQQQPQQPQQPQQQQYSQPGAPQAPQAPPPGQAQPRPVASGAPQLKPVGQQQQQQQQPKPAPVDPQSAFQNQLAARLGQVNLGQGASGAPPSSAGAAGGAAAGARPPVSAGGAVGGRPLQSRPRDSRDEARTFSKFINNVFTGNADLADSIPLNPEADDLYTVISKSVLLCFLVNHVRANTVTGFQMKPKNIFEQNANHVKSLAGARTVGCKLINIGPEDIQNANQKMILAVVWQLIRMSLVASINLQHHPEMINLKLQQENVKDFVELSPEEALLRWVNHHLRNAGLAPIANLGADLDIDKLIHLVHQIAPHLNALQLLSDPDPLSRAQKLLRLIEQGMGCKVFMDGQDLLNGNEKLNLALLATLFNKNSGLAGPSNDVLSPELAAQRAREIEEAMRQKIAREEDELRRRMAEEEARMHQRLLEAEQAMRDRLRREEEETRRRWEEEDRLRQQQHAKLQYDDAALRKMREDQEAQDRLWEQQERLKLEQERQRIREESARLEEQRRLRDQQKYNPTAASLAYGSFNPAGSVPLPNASFLPQQTSFNPSQMNLQMGGAFSTGQQSQPQIQSQLQSQQQQQQLQAQMQLQAQLQAQQMLQQQQQQFQSQQFQPQQSFQPQQPMQSFGAANLALNSAMTGYPQMSYGGTTMGLQMGGAPGLEMGISDPRGATGPHPGIGMSLGGFGAPGALPSPQDQLNMDPSIYLNSAHLGIANNFLNSQPPPGY